MHNHDDPLYSWKLCFSLHPYPCSSRVSSTDQTTAGHTPTDCNTEVNISYDAVRMKTSTSIQDKITTGYISSDPTSITKANVSYDMAMRDTSVMIHAQGEERIYQEIGEVQKDDRESRVMEESNYYYY